MGSLGQIGAASIGATSDLINNGLNMWNTWRTNEQAYDQSRKLWALNNEYNKPINQMKRLEEARLNPFLVYGNGATGNTSAQPSSPSVQRAHFNIDAANSILFGKSMEKMNEEISKVQNENSLLKTQLGNLRYNSKIFKDLGLPTNSAWWSPSVFSLFKSPQMINRLKKLGFAISDILWNNNPKFFGDDEYPADKSGINNNWLNNGQVVSETYYEFTE